MAVVLIAGLAVLLVFDIIPRDVFSEGALKTVLLALIVGLASVAVGLILRIGK